MSYRVFCMIQLPTGSTRTDTLFPSTTLFRSTSSRPAGRPGEKLEHGDALFSRKYGQATAVVIFDRVFVPWERVFYAGEWEHSHVLTYSYATHHRHSCIAARAGFGDLLIGAGALMRSEEHTSELQSLMRISYAVCCLQKKTKKKSKHDSPESIRKI